MHELIINSYAIPINKEDLFEFLQVSCSQSLEGSDYMIQLAWRRKSKEALLKSKLAFINDEKFKLFNDYEIILNKSEKKEKINKQIMLFIFLIFIALIVIFGQ
jgi:hypothetical protein